MTGALRSCDWRESDFKEVQCLGQLVQVVFFNETTLNVQQVKVPPDAPPPSLSWLQALRAWKDLRGHSVSRMETRHRKHKKML